MSSFLDLGPFRIFSGTIRLPGSKSISNRVLLLAALAKGQTQVQHVLDSDDTRVMLNALQTLGVKYQHEGNAVNVEGGVGQFNVKRADLFLGNAGTAVRPLTAVLAIQQGYYRIHGVPRMHERPIGDLVDGLCQLGAQIDYEQRMGFPPLFIRPASMLNDVAPILMKGTVSSQFLTALLIALPLISTASGQVVIRLQDELISKPYVQMTIDLMAKFGVQVERQGWHEFIIPTNTCYISPGHFFVEGDASSASYFLAAGLLGKGPVCVEGLGSASIQGDIRFVDVLQKMGARLNVDKQAITLHAPFDRPLKAIDLDCNLIPDAAMTLAVLALFADAPSTLRNIASWRVKETDRIAAMACELRKLGATVQEGDDYLTIVPPAHLHNAVAIDTYDDHRMAMCFSLVSLMGKVVRINEPECVAKTFPDYFQRFLELAQNKDT